jgi:hypothetical protein
MLPYLQCSLTGEPTLYPCVFVKTGDIYESSAIKWYLNSKDKCPLTSQPMTQQDLIPLHTFKGPRTAFKNGLSPYSISNLIKETFVSEVRDTRELKKTIISARKKLSKALKKQEAAINVINRLRGERDDARRALTKIFTKVDKSIMNTQPESLDVMPRSLEEKIQEFAIRSTQARVKKNNDKIISELKSEFAEYKKCHTFEVPASMSGKKTAIFHPMTPSHQYVFDNTGKFSSYDSEAKKLTNFTDLDLGAEMTCHCVNTLLSNESTISLSFGAANGTFLIRNFNSTDSTSTVQYKNSGAGSDLGMISIEQHPLNTFLVTLGEEKYVSIFDLNSERSLFKRQFEDDLDLR